MLIYDLTDSWSSSGTTWFGIKLDVADTGSADDSCYLSLQLAGDPVFEVGKTGAVRAVDGAEALPAYTFLTSPTSGLYAPAADTIALTLGEVEQVLFESELTTFHFDVLIEGALEATDLTLSGDFTADNLILTGDLTAVGGTFSGALAADSAIFTTTLACDSLSVTTNITASGIGVTALAASTIVANSLSVVAATFSGSGASPVNNGDLTFVATSNTSLTFYYKGTDGVIRSASLVLA